MKIQAIKKLFTEHPSSVNETYFRHLKKALFFSFSFFKGTIALFINALLHFLFVEYGSSMIIDLHQKTVINRIKKTLD